VLINTLINTGYNASVYQMSHDIVNGRLYYIYVATQDMMHDGCRTSSIFCTQCAQLWRTGWL